MRKNAFSLTSADSSRHGRQQPKTRAPRRSASRLLADTCRQTWENGSMLSRAIE